MRNKNKLKIVRRCAICHKTGHNSRSCPLGIKKEKIAKKNVAKKENLEKTVLIKITNEQNIDFSPYIINLDKREKNKNWEKIIPYQEKTKIKNIYQTLDFSKLIKNHKIKNVENIKNLIEKETEIKKEAKNILEPQVKVDILAEIAKLQKNSQPVRIDLNKNLINKFDLKKYFLILKDAISEIEFKKYFQDFFKPRKIDFHFDFIWNWRKMAVSSIALFLLVAVPYPSFSFYKQVEYDTLRIVDSSSNAFLSLQSSTVSVLNSNVEQAEYDLTEALKNFGSAEQILDNEYHSLVFIGKLVPFLGKKIKSRQNLLEAGHKIALANTYLVKAINELQANPSLSLLEKINIVKNHIRFASPNYSEALEKINDVKLETLPIDYQNSFEEFKNIYSLFVADMDNMVEVAESIELFMGSEGFRRYMILFQNQNEIRATGGFVGSYAIVDIQNGKILDIDIPGGGSYDLQGQLKEFVLPPLALQTVNERWEFQDGNWFVNFSDTAKKMEWFYQNSRNSTVDGVIAINASVLERILKVLGPIENKEFNLFLESEDALKKLQYEVANYNGEENTPKAVLSSLFDQLFSSLNNIEAKQMFALVFNIHEAFEEKEIQVFFKEKEIQNVFSKYSWTGEIKKTEKEDYLYVVNSNIGGGKSDFNIKQTIEHQSVIEEDGSIINTVVITRTHVGSEDEYLFGDANVDYVRVYVPQGSELLEAGGFVYPDEESFNVSPDWYTEDKDLALIEKNKKISEENGTTITEEYDKTVFANWIVTNSGEEKKIYFVYKLPFNAFRDLNSSLDIDNSDASIRKNILFNSKENISNYSVIFQKQSGINSRLIHTVIYPESWVPVWRTSEDYKVSQNGGYVDKDLKKDSFYGLLLQKK